MSTIPPHAHIQFSYEGLALSCSVTSRCSICSLKVKFIGKVRKCQDFVWSDFSVRKHAQVWAGDVSSNSGTVVEHTSILNLHLGLNLQPKISSRMVGGCPEIVSSVFNLFEGSEFISAFE